MTFKLLTEQHLEFLSLKRGCTCSSESIPVKMPHCWISHIAAYLLKLIFAGPLSGTSDPTDVSCCSQGGRRGMDGCTGNLSLFEIEDLT